jgi:hypothetical protein
MDIDIGNGCSMGNGDVLIETVALRLFLADRRFSDLRSPREIAFGAPLSRGNCIAASYLLECALNSVDPEGDWLAVAGRCMSGWHAFVMDRRGGSIPLIADVTADQFGLAPVILKALVQAEEFEVRCSLSDSYRYTSGDLAEYRRWRVGWMREAKMRRQQARAIVTPHLLPTWRPMGREAEWRA